MLGRLVQYLHLWQKRRLLCPGATLWDQEEESEVEVISHPTGSRCLVRYPDGWERIVEVSKLTKAR